MKKISLEQRDFLKEERPMFRDLYAVSTLLYAAGMLRARAVIVR